MPHLGRTHGAGSGALPQVKLVSTRVVVANVRYVRVTSDRNQHTSDRNQHRRLHQPMITTVDQHRRLPQPMMTPVDQHRRLHQPMMTPMEPVYCGQLSERVTNTRKHRLITLVLETIFWGDTTARKARMQGQWFI